MDRTFRRGVRRDQLVIASRSASTGKSVFNGVDYATLTTALDDTGNTWYTIACCDTVYRWIEASQPKDQWVNTEFVVNRYLIDVSEQVYLQLVLKWS